MTRVEKSIVLFVVTWMFLLLIFAAVGNAEIINHLIAGNIRHTEGLVLQVYKDPSNSNMSIGYGYNLSNGITVDVAEYLLQLKLEECTGELRSIFGNAYDEFTLARQIALVDMIYAMGRRTFLSFDDMVKCIKRGDWPGASHNVLYNDKAGKVRTIWAKKYTSRAKKVAMLLETGEVPDNMNYNTPEDVRVIELPESRIVTIEFRR